jgi:hypothetical protein
MSNIYCALNRETNDIEAYRYMVDLSDALGVNYETLRYQFKRMGRARYDYNGYTLYILKMNK